MRYEFVYGNGNPFSALSKIGPPTLADRLAASMYDGWPKLRRFMPMRVWDAAEHYLFSVRRYVHCSGCFRVLWQRHAFVGYHDGCRARMLAQEVFDTRI